MIKVKCVTLVIATIGVALIIAGCQETAPSAAPAKPPSVPVAEVLVRPVTPFVEFTGSLTAVKRVELRPRVAGYIQDVSVPEGRLVEKGSRLFLIDPRVFQAALDAATARLREAEAASMLAQAEYARAEQLFAKKVVARDRLDSAIASRNAGKAQVDAAKAALEAAQLDMSFTRVTAPISGRVGHTLVTEGNYVTNGVTPLTTIVSVDPLHVYFDVDERTYLRSLAPGRAKAGAQNAQAPTVRVALLTDTTYSRLSRLDFLSNAADRGTGTVRVRAVVDNPDGQLTPGLFAKVKLETGAPQDQVMVSDQSIGTDQGSRYVLVVGEGNKTQYRPVELGPIVDGLRVINQGLRAGDRIVVKGLVRPDMQITPQLAAIDGTPIDMSQALGVAP
ncbi:efflux RND transporter periplasmic adaptor subunit [Pseudomonas alkylphenolica]|uniref:Efflux RND transporter periplasmic adaptor subunit n=1 Tax=Pseudomonas alkylphenolica TaxID=237609 RepID=A0A6I6GSX8_9PSED|nr:efflux RND transporter periplasmic adaptor subunit [Pseudomonas alkylphenolica]QGW77593.1 efflux RND transporter periplasmic adaptor subunit [Pseudomonas alkylphenolica]